MENNENISFDWISVKERLPDDTGWYKVKFANGGEVVAPLSTTMSGKKVWVVPDENSITHWMPDIINI